MRESMMILAFTFAISVLCFLVQPWLLFAFMVLCFIYYL